MLKTEDGRVPIAVAEEEGGTKRRVPSSSAPSRFERTVRVLITSSGYGNLLNLRTGEQTKISKRVMNYTGFDPMLLPDGRLLSAEGRSLVLVDGRSLLLVDGNRMTLQDITLARSSNTVDDSFLRFGDLFVNLYRTVLSVYRLSGDVLKPYAVDVPIPATVIGMEMEGSLLRIHSPEGSVVWYTYGGRLRSMPDPDPSRNFDLLLHGSTVWLQRESGFCVTDAETNERKRFFPEIFRVGSQTGEKTQFLGREGAEAEFLGEGEARYMYSLSDERVLTEHPFFRQRVERKLFKLWDVAGEECVKVVSVPAGMSYGGCAGEVFWYEETGNLVGAQPKEDEERRIVVYDLDGFVVADEKTAQRCTVLPGARLLMTDRKKDGKTVMMDLHTGERREWPVGGQFVQWVVDDRKEESERLRTDAEYLLEGLLANLLRGLVAKYV